MPIHPDPTPDDDAKGTRIERRLFKILAIKQRDRVIDRFGKPDAWIIDDKNGFYLIEVKAQERFKAGWVGPRGDPKSFYVPFDGHGLPISQADAYMSIRYLSGVRTLLLIFEKDGTVFKQWIDVLEETDYVDLPGTIKTPRRVYPIMAFRNGGTA